MSATERPRPNYDSNIIVSEINHPIPWDRGAFSVRLHNRLVELCEQYGIITLSDFQNITYGDIAKHPGLGEKSVKEMSYLADDKCVWCYESPHKNDCEFNPLALELALRRKTLKHPSCPCCTCSK